MATQYIEVHGVREPKLLALRERRPVPGLEDRYEVTRTGNVWSTMKKTWLKGYAEVLLHVEGQKVYAKTNYLVVLAWLSEEDRQRVRALLAETPEMERRRVCAELATTYGVSSYALEWVGLMPAEEFRAVEVVKQRYGQILPEPPRS
jgi:hypothetical protein